MRASITRRKLIGGAAKLALTSPLLGLAGCFDDEGPVRLPGISGSTMGTRYSVRLNDLPNGAATSQLRVGIDDILETVNRQMSNWRPESEISSLNAASETAWTGVSTDTFQVIDQALAVSRLSGGAFDPTIGPLVDLWGFGPGSDGPALPSDRTIAAALDAMGFSRLQTREADNAVSKQRGDVHLDLSGIAKGFGVDRMALFLDRQGVDDYLVEIGGELRARGNGQAGRPWRVGIERPMAGRRSLHRVVALDGAAIATSGNYRNFFQKGTRTYTHIIDPRTGMPVSHELASATVIAPTAMQADAFSTALMVMGPTDGLDFAVQNRIAALFIVRDGVGFADAGTPQFAPYLVD